MDLYFVTISVRDRRPLARDEAERRLVLRTLAAIGRERLVSFALPEDHAHTALGSPRVAIVARDLRAALARLRPDLELKPPDIERLETRTSLRRVLRYQLEQWDRHGLDGHPANATGSCFPDLVGARLMAGFGPGPLLAALPGIRRRDLFPLVGLEPRPLEPVGDDALHELGAHGLVDLVAAVLALPPRFAGDSRLETAGRALALTLARQVGRRLAEVGDVLRVTRQAASQLSRRRVPEAAELAVRLRRALDVRVLEHLLQGRAAALLSEVESRGR